jgi:myo-inositol-1(or 4)-monophosphatase
MDYKKICLDAVEVVKQAAGFIKTESKKFNQSAVVYKGFNDLVSYVDKTSEHMLVNRLGELIDGCGFITEENSVPQTNADFQWIIDPLDGTTNFVHGVPCYCISVALMYKMNLVAGIIYEINLGECFYAWKDGGAWLDGKAIEVSKINTLQKSLIATGFPYTNYERMEPYMQVFDYCMHNTHGLRRLGSAAVDLAYVACGRFEGFYEYGLNAWDVAAGAFIVEQAGGKVSDFSGSNNYVFGREIIATNSAMYDEFLGVVKKYF